MNFSNMFNVAEVILKSFQFLIWLFARYSEADIVLVRLSRSGTGSVEMLSEVY